jgi:hypothetical protein
MSDKPTKTSNEELEQMLKFDALDCAEQICQESYKGNNAVTGLGLLLQMANSDQKN